MYKHTDKGRAGSKRHLVVDAEGVPLAVRLTAANVNDCQLFEELLDGIPALRRRGPGQLRRRPAKVRADKGYDFRKCRRACRVRNIRARIAARVITSASCISGARSFAGTTSRGYETLS